MAEGISCGRRLKECRRLNNVQEDQRTQPVEVRRSLTALMAACPVQRCFPKSCEVLDSRGERSGDNKPSDAAEDSLSMIGSPVLVIPEMDPIRELVKVARDV